jgi:hypothetical protein
MCLVDDENEWSSNSLSASEGYFFEFIQSSLNVEYSACIAGSTYREERSNVVLMVLKVQTAAEADPKDFEISMGLHHRAAFAVDLSHGIYQHRALPGALFT